MFPLVSVQVRQQGAWKFQPYKFIAQNCLLLPFWLNITKPFEAPEIDANTTHADMLAFTLTLHQIHTQPYWYLPPSYTTTIGYIYIFSSPDTFLTTTGTHTHYYTNFKTLKYFWHGPHVPWNFTTHIYPHFCFAFHTPTHHNALICNFSVQVSYVSHSITSKSLMN